MTFTPAAPAPLVTVRPLVVLVDLDGPIADLEAAIIAAMVADGRTEFIATENRRGFRMGLDYALNLGPEAGEQVFSTMRRPGIYRDLPVVPGAIRSLNALVDAGHTVRICTSPLTENPTCASDKLAWVAAKLGTDWVDRVIITKDKTFAIGDVLIDDKPHIDGALTPTWTHLIYDTAYNRDVDDDRARLTWATWATDLARHAPPTSTWKQNS